MKTDQETQSPLLKLFRDMVQRDKRDPEKTNLLSGKHIEKKRKHFSGYRSKSEQKSVDSSSSDLQHSYKHTEELRNAEYHRSQSQSLPYQGSKSWVLWGEKDCCSKKERTNDDTCSCVSCALKKLIGSDYACVGCLALLFSISVIIACLLVYKCMPSITNIGPKHDSGRLKRKIDSINGWGSFMPKTFGGFNKHKWQDSGIRDLGMVDADSELLKIIDDSKLNEIQSSSRLREFYKRLLKADSNIRKLKKSTEYTTFDTNFDFGLKSLPEREKRSVNFLKKPFKLFHHRKRKSNKTTIERNKFNDTNLTPAQNLRHKRFGNNSEDTIVIEKDQVLIQYKPRIVPKCSHNIPKDVKSHEHLLKHPFYKNTQRLDELLDQFNNHLPEIINDQFGLNLLFDDKKFPSKHMKADAGENKNKMAEHEKVKMADKPKINNKEKVDTKKYQTDYDMFRKMRNGNPNMEGAKTNGYADFDGETLKRDDLSKNNFNVLLTVSTIMNQKRTTPYLDQMQRVPNLRRLLQVDGEDDESINYEDLKEVLTDDNQDHDDNDKNNRKKRFDDFNPYNVPTTKYHPPNVNNPNWKGPMPLYPDEINSMIKQGPIVVNKADRPVNGEESNDISDLDYIQDYLNNKYQGLVELAQAYSDYGVLSDKKPATQKGTNKKSENRKKISPGGKDAFGRHKKSKENEGIVFEITPTTTAREDKPMDLQKFIRQHVRFTNTVYKKPTNGYSTANMPKTEFIDKKYNYMNKNVFLPPYLKEKRSLNIHDGSNVHRVSLGNDNHPIFIDLINDKVNVDNRNKKEFRNNQNDRSKQKSNIEIEKETSNNLNEKIIIENDNNKVFKKRSLKSYEETNNTKVNDHLLDKSEKKIDETQSKDDKKLKTDVKEDISKENVSYNETKRSDMDLSDFFMMLSNIFSAMDSEYVATEPYNTTNSVQNSIKASTQGTTDVLYPMYDSEMFDNIGHRSRVLLSTNSTDGHQNENEVACNNDDAKKLIINITNSNLSNIKDSIKNKTARIVKRHADGNTIFWNDIYDDEYGVKMDVFENIKDKSSATNEFMRRSNEWIQDKVRKISDNFHRSKNEDDNDGRRVGRSVWNSHNNGNGNGRHSFSHGKNNKFNRKIRNSEESEDKRTDFSALTVHMKDVCRRAATAVKESTENIEISAKEDKENAATTSLMQHLVSLMTDLIDFQVEQRTCMKLPPDLRSFLDWLTDVTPSDEGDDDEPNHKLLVNQPGDIRDEKPLEHPSDMPSERDDQDPRSDCLGTLQAIQDLLRSFEDMPESDKSKMTGVKDYLLNQIKYLKKRLADEEYTSSVEQYPLVPYRYRRDLSKRRGGRHHHKYLRNYSKKHTKTTASYYDGVTFTEPYDVLTRRTIKEKRNLRDVYYRAVADAKKITTIIFNNKD